MISTVNIDMRFNSPISIRRIAVTTTVAVTSLFTATAWAQMTIPSITSVIPSAGTVGTRVTLAGSGFSPTGNTVHFGSGGTANVPAADNGTRIIYSIPNAVGPNDLNPNIKAPLRIVSPGVYQMFTVNAQMQKSNLVSFTVTP